LADRALGEHLRADIRLAPDSRRGARSHRRAAVVVERALGRPFLFPGLARFLRCRRRRAPAVAPRSKLSWSRVNERVGPEFQWIGREAVEIGKTSVICEHIPECG